jgi:hypothetical protein
MCLWSCERHGSSSGKGKTMSKNESVDAASMHPIVHMPGPWVMLDLREKGEECITIAHKATPQALCRIRNEVSGIPLNEEDVANAKLIAAAPELKEALERLFNEVDTHFLCSDEKMSEAMREAYNEAMDLLS